MLNKWKTFEEYFKNIPLPSEEAQTAFRDVWEKAYDAGHTEGYDDGYEDRSAEESEDE